MGEARGAAVGVGAKFAGKQRKIRRLKYERKEKYRRTMMAKMQEITVTSRSQYDSR